MRKRHFFAGLLCFATMLAAFGAWVPFLTRQQNTLDENGHWLSFKRRLEMPLFGEEAYCGGTQALAGNRLNLHPWHAFQEVLWREKAVPRRISFRFLLAENSYVSLVFNRTFDDFDGIRFSAAPDYASLRFTAARGGEFVARELLPCGRVTEGDWHECTADFEAGKVAVSLDGGGRWEFPAEMKERCWFGFKGGANPASVDDVTIVLHDGRRFVERFDKSVYYPETARRYAPWALLLECLLAAGLYLRFRAARATVSWLCALNIWVAAAGFTLIVFTMYFLEERYPKTTVEMKKKETSVIKERLAALCGELKLTYGHEKAPGTKRILIMGTSQMWGAGASSREARVFVQLEALLKEAGIPAEVIPGAIPGATSVELLACLKDEWLSFAPDLVVVNLSCNDRDPERFRKNLSEMAEVCAAKTIPIVFVQEAFCPEIASEGDSNYTIVRETSEKWNAPLLSPSTFLNERADSGFLFWDVVHLTDYGQRVLAEYLASPLRGILAGR